MKRRAQGFSLIEALITLTLMSILLGVVASLMRDASILMRQANTDPMVGLQSALATISADLRCAYKVNQCDNAAVAFVRLDPWDTERVPNPVPNPIPTEFSLHNAINSRTVRYFVQDGALWCQTDYADASSETNEVAPSISAMDGSLTNGLVELSLSTNDANSDPVKVLSLQTLVVLHLPKEVMP